MPHTGCPFVDIQGSCSDLIHGADGGLLSEVSSIVALHTCIPFFFCQTAGNICRLNFGLRQILLIINNLRLRV